MTSPDYTALMMIIDRSGSMGIIADDAEGAVNVFVQQQAEQPGKCTLRVAQFDHEYELVHESTPIADVPVYKLIPRGNTALYDAIGRGIVEFGAELEAMDEDERPGKVLVVVQTDGQENSSYEWNSLRVNELITRQRETFSWDFLFLGANQDAIKTGGAMGFATGSSLTFGATAQGVRSANATASTYASTYRSTGSAVISDDDRSSAVQ